MLAATARDLNVLLASVGFNRANAGSTRNFNKQASSEIGPHASNGENELFSHGIYPL